MNSSSFVSEMFTFWYSCLFILQLGSVISFQGCHLYASNYTEHISSPDFFPELQTQIPWTFSGLKRSHPACPEELRLSCCALLRPVMASVSQSGTRTHTGLSAPTRPPSPLAPQCFLTVSPSFYPRLLVITHKS